MREGVPLLHLALTGPAGTGKSTVRDKLAACLGLIPHSVGDIFRDIAIRREISPDELEVIADTDHTVDHELDQKTLMFARTRAKEKEGYVIEGRRVAYVLPGAIPILLVCDDEVRFERIFQRDREKKKYKTVKDAEANTRERERITSNRYNRFYKQTLAQLLNLENFGIVVDTTAITPEAAAEQIMSQLGLDVGITTVVASS